MRRRGRTFWHVQKRSENDRPNSTGKGRRKLPRLWLSISSGHSTLMIGEAASWPRQNRAGSSSVYKNFSLLSTTLRVTRGSTAVMRMGLVRSGAGTGTQTPLVGVWKSLIQEVCKELGPFGVPPWLSHGDGEYSGHLLFQCPLSDKKGALVQAQSASWWSL